MTDGLTQPIGIRIEEYLELINEIDEVVHHSITVGDPTGAFTYGLGYVKTMRLTAYALAALIYKLDINWERFNIEGDFYDTVTERLGIARPTAIKYRRMWEAIFENQEIPSETKALLAGRSVEETLKLTALASEDDVKVEIIQEASLAPDYVTLIDVVRRARGEQTSSKTGITMYIIDRADHPRYPRGTMLMKRNHSPEMKVVGLLKVDDEDPDVQYAITKVKNRNRLVEK